MKQLKYLHLLTFFSFFLIGGCLYEPPAVFYNFIIINNTRDSVRLDYKTIKDEKVTHKDLAPNEKINLEIMKMHCYQDFYKDSLIFTFFDSLKIKSSKKQYDLELFLRRNWKETLNLDISNCKGGYVKYEIEISNIIKMQ